MLNHVQEVAAVEKKFIYIIIIKPQFDFLHHQEEKALKRLVEVEI